MSTTTWDDPRPRVRVGPDHLHPFNNQIGFARLLAARDALTVKVRSVGTVIASVARAALRQARRLADYLHLARLGGVLTAAARWSRNKAAVPLGLLRRVLTPAGAVWALTTPTGQRLTRTVLGTSLRFLEAALMRTTDLAMGVLGRCGRIGRWAAGLLGNASAGIVLTVAKITDKVRTTVGPWVSADRLHVRVVNAVAGLVFLRQLSGLLPPVLRAPVMVLAVAITVGRAGRTGFARGLSGFAELLAEAAGVSNAVAGVLAGARSVRVDVNPTETTRRITVEVPDPAEGGLPAAAPIGGDPAGPSAGSAGSGQPRTNAQKRAEAKRSGSSGSRH